MAREKIEPSINHHANGATVSCIYRGTLYKRMQVKTREYGKPNLVAPADDQASVVVTDTKSEDVAIEEAFDEMNNVFGH